MSNLGLADLTSRTTKMAKRMKVAKDKDGHLTERRAPPSKDGASSGESKPLEGKARKKFPGMNLHDNPRSPR